MPIGVLLACSLALPQALARSSERAVSAPRAAGHAAVTLRSPKLFRHIASKATARLKRAAGPPLVVRRVIAAGDRIAHAPYGYGGGHGNWDAGAYDCSGSVSYALHGGGLLDSPLVSGDFARWGAEGNGRWITIYANGGHVYMVVAGMRFDTSARSQTGSRWTMQQRPSDGFSFTHPKGL